MTQSQLHNKTIDQFTRQQWAKDLIDEVNPNSKTILDVGGYKGLTGAFCSKHKVTICDLFDIDEPNYVKGDGRRLPFGNDSFDFVVSFDTYEHVPREGREQFIKELMRVAKNAVILAAPFDTDDGAVSLAETRLNDYHKHILDGADHPWLKEHIDFVIPKSTEMESLLKKLGIDSYSFGTNDLRDWSLFQTVYFSIGLDDDLQGRADDMNRLYNKHYQEIDLASDDTAYRRIYFLSENLASIEKVKMFIQDKSKKQSLKLRVNFITTALEIFGLKYRDTTNYASYLNGEVERLKRENEDRNRSVETLQNEVNTLTAENKILKEKSQESFIKKLMKKGK
jgi:O-antigen biosynthesis protein